MVEEAKRLIRTELLPEIHKLDRDVKLLQKIGAGLGVLLVLAGLFVWRQGVYDNCTTDRARVVGGSFYTAYNALDKILVEDAGLPNTPVNRAKGFRDLEAYKAASAKYRAAQRAHPVCHRVGGVW